MCGGIGAGAGEAEREAAAETRHWLWSCLEPLACEGSRFSFVASFVAFSFSLPLPLSLFRRFLVFPPSSSFPFSRTAIFFFVFVCEGERERALLRGSKRENEESKERERRRRLLSSSLLSLHHSLRATAAFSSSNPRSQSNSFSSVCLSSRRFSRYRNPPLSGRCFFFFFFLFCFFSLSFSSSSTPATHHHYNLPAPLSTKQNQFTQNKNEQPPAP